MKEDLHNQELEEIILGAILLEKNAYVQVQGIITAETFFFGPNKTVYQACDRLFKAGTPIDIQTVTHQLNEMDSLDTVGGAYGIARLTNRVASSANIEFHARIIKEHELRRNLINITSNIQAEAGFLDKDIFETIEKITVAISELTRFTGRVIESTPQLVDRIIEKIEKAKGHSGITGVETGLERLDEKTGGWQETDLIIIAGRPGMAKTAFILTTAHYQAVNDVPIGFVSGELSALQITIRRATLITGVPYQNIIRGKDIYSHDFRTDIKVIDREDDPFYISEDMDLNQICIQIKVWVMEKKIKIAYIDYLQLITVSGVKNREEAVATASKRLKGLAKELQIPIVAVAALNRAVEQRGGHKTPQLSDLRESGQIEYDADIIMFTYRPEIYGITEDENGATTINKGSLLIEKHRSGPLGPEKFDFIKHKMLWQNETDVQLEITEFNEPKEAVSKMSREEIDILLNEPDDPPF